MNQVLKYSLENLDMIVDDNLTSGLLPVQEIHRNKNLAPEEIIALENAYNYGAHYVYFRKFENRPSVPQVYLYDFTNKIGIEEDELTNLHKQLYSSGQVPMFFVFTKKDVRIFNCFERPADGNNLKYKPLTIIELASGLSKKIDSKNQEKFKAFSGKSFDNGTFWENSKYSDQFKFSNSAYERLLIELKQALKDIISQDILPAHFARRIMVVSILIKYLEEREDEKGNKVFPEKFFSRFTENATKFTDVLNKTGAFLELLDYLARHFNGGIFQLEDNEREFILEKDLTRFGQFLDGDLEGIQLVFWRLYSFNDLPVELISNIYEEFLGKQPGVVYTPPYLVNFLLDEAMPLSNEETDFKVLDPACGSGVFLVGAYRRLIYRWRKKNNWNDPDLLTLKGLLRENIFGVELNKEAADLTVFSLSLALCDELTPLQIWKDLKFDDLQKENILHEDFFNVVSKSEFQNKFDLVIGNPPFEAKLTDAAKIIEKEKSKVREISVILKNGQTQKQSVKLPDNQISLLFLEQSVELSKKDGLVCLIQPSGPLLYNNSSFQFRRCLFEKYDIPQIIDFTSLSEVLYGNANIATSAIFIKNKKSFQRGVYHITIKRSKENKEKIYLNIDTYDFHFVSFKEIINNKYIWKANLLGGNRVKQLFNRFEDLRTLGEYLDEKVANNGWVYGEGYIVSENLKEIKELKELENRSHLSEEENKRLNELTEIYKSDYLPGKLSFDPKDFSSEGIIERYLIKDEYFTRKRNPIIYQSPLLLIKEVVENNSYIIPIGYQERDICFKNSVLGIHGNSKDELKKIEKRLKNNRFYSFYAALISGRFMINKSSSLLVSDIKGFPFPEDDSELELNIEEEIIIEDFFNYLLPFRRSGERSEISKKNVSAVDLIKFGNIFSSILANSFQSITPHPYFETDLYICFPFYFGNKPNIDFSNSQEAETHIEQLVQKNLGVSLRLTRIIRLYEGNVIYLIKPKKLRYWLKSIALRDADETFSDLRKQGY